jgi:glyoxylase-like metal-dependent hydrolase (beta-lactamase superfamily II)
MVGSVELLPLRDAVGVLGQLAELYPDAPLEAWEPYRVLYPEAFRGTSWRIPCTCYLIRSGRRVVLVDTGVGPPGLWDWDAEEEGGLLPGLARHGVEPRDVDTVVLTHVHVDHVGWNTDAAGELVFPRARFLAHRDAIAAARRSADIPHIPRCVLSLAEKGVVDELDGEEQVADGVTVVPLPGHASGHVGVRIASNGAEALLIGDAAVHPVLLDQPSWRYMSDRDHEESVATRRALLADVLDRDVLVVCGHYPGGGIGRVTRRDGRSVWEEAA